MSFISDLLKLFTNTTSNTGYIDLIPVTLITNEVILVPTSKASLISAMQNSQVSDYQIYTSNRALKLLQVGYYTNETRTINGKYMVWIGAIQNKPLAV